MLARYRPTVIIIMYCVDSENEDTSKMHCTKHGKYTIKV